MLLNYVMGMTYKICGQEHPILCAHIFYLFTCTYWSLWKYSHICWNCTYENFWMMYLTVFVTLMWEACWWNSKSGHFFHIIIPHNLSSSLLYLSPFLPSSDMCYVKIVNKVTPLYSRWHSYEHRAATCISHENYRSP